MGSAVQYKMFLVILLLTIVMLEITNVQKVVCVDASQECNGTNSSIGGCLADADEFMMESETNAMLLANVKRISNRALQKPQLCRAAIYGNCISNPKNPPKRPCNFENRCKRAHIYWYELEYI
ncbi:rapid alkalinization factor [Capsicum annuum]|uniref:rapid alkalinization factor n=1 Tax=Capsicum annuum TaxID=4072 RepID=UPI001FB0D94C|nr:rapid alkalinization factor [Capsicum annuum]